MNRYQQSAGEVEITVYTDGWPLRHTVKFGRGHREIEVLLSTDGLHDLRYCIDRILAQIPGGDR